MPGERRADRAHHGEEHRRAWQPEEEERRRDQQRQTGGVNGIDLAVRAAAQVIRLERARVIFEVIAAQVVVLDPDVAVSQQALRDHEIMRRVAARRDR
jgi:hypothetical protein